MSNSHSRCRDLLAAVHEASGCVHVTAWRAVGLAHGYQVRGLAGFFDGSSPSMIFDGPWRCLTESGRQRI